MLTMGNIELEGELGTILLDELPEDVAVNERHALELASSIKVAGQISPIIVWKEGRRIIDGFHRVRGLNLTGKKEAICLLYSCDEETFWNLRILNAVTHKSVSFARIVTWVRTAFSVTEWAQKMEVGDAFRIGRRGAATHLALTAGQRQELTVWVKEKAQLWNLSVRRINQMLRIAHLADPDLIGEVRDESQPGMLTQSMLEYISRKLRQRELQQAVVQRIRIDKLSLKDVQRLVDLVAEAKIPRERSQLLNKPYERPKRGRPSQSAYQSLEQLRTGVVRDALEQLVILLPELKSPQPFDNRLTDVLATLHIYMGEEESTALEILQRENRESKEENSRLVRKIDEQDELISSQQRSVIELQNTLARRD